jgi:uncharacterized protein (TIGR00730 family)
VSAIEAKAGKTRCSDCGLHDHCAHRLRLFGERAAGSADASVPGRGTLLALMPSGFEKPPGERGTMSATEKQSTKSVSLGDEEAVRKILVSSVLGLWDVVSELTRLKPSRRDRYRVTIFGSARAERGSFGYEETKRAARALAALGCDIVTGGGPGLMQAANEGAKDAGGSAESVGIRVDLPFEQGLNDFVTQSFEHRTFFTRLHQFVLTSDAFVVAPGGIGTVLETFMIWQLLQVHHLDGTPLVLVGKMWPGLVDWAKSTMLATEPPLASESDLAIPHCAANADDAVALIREHRARWLARDRTG